MKCRNNKNAIKIFDNGQCKKQLSNIEILS